MTTLPPAGSARARTLHFLNDPSRWPLWPFLPLTRRRPAQEVELGVLFDALHAVGLTGFSSCVFLTNLLFLPRTLGEFLALPHQTFDTAEELVDAGWIVD